MTLEIQSKKQPIGRREALDLARQASRIIAIKGTKQRELDMLRKPSEDEILSLLLGPTGKLRAPSFIAGHTLYVGFPREGGFAGLRG